MNLLSSQKAAAALGISVLTLYDWLSQSDSGEFAIRGESTTITYFQGGRKGQGRIRIDQQEIDRLMSLMQVSPTRKKLRKQPAKAAIYPHISVKLGRPD